MILCCYKYRKMYLPKLLFPSSSEIKIYLCIDKQEFEKFCLHGGDFCQMGGEKKISIVILCCYKYRKIYLPFLVWDQNIPLYRQGRIWKIWSPWRGLLPNGGEKKSRSWYYVVINIVKYIYQNSYFLPRLRSKYTFQ